MKKTKLFVLGVALLSLLVGCEFVGNSDVSSESSFISENSNETSKGRDSKSRRPLGDSSTIEDEKARKELQKEIFKRQCAYAKEIDKPIIVHSREAAQDTYDILKEYKLCPKDIDKIWKIIKKKNSH